MTADREAGVTMSCNTPREDYSLVKDTTFAMDSDCWLNEIRKQAFLTESKERHYNLKRTEIIP